MFGIYRTILAILVVAQHCGLWGLGQSAVILFFCLSGFLMTLLMDTNYEGRRAAFAVNRFLRLYPIYWATMLLTLVFILLGFQAPRGFIGIPTGFTAIRAIAYVNFSFDRPQLVSVSWAVTNEIIMYALICFGVSKTPRSSLVWMCISIIYTVISYEFTRREEFWQYFSPLAASLPFSIGACAYHARNIMTLPAWGKIVSLIALVVVLYAGHKFSGLYTPKIALLVIVPFVTIALYQTKITATIALVDKHIGDLSYPIYLNHMTAMMLVIPILKKLSGYPFFLITLAISVALAAATNMLINSRIEAIRSRVRKAPVLAKDQSP